MNIYIHANSLNTNSLDEALSEILTELEFSESVWENVPDRANEQ